MVVVIFSCFCADCQFCLLCLIPTLFQKNFEGKKSYNDSVCKTFNNNFSEKLVFFLEHLSRKMWVATDTQQCRNNSVMDSNWPFLGLLYLHLYSPNFGQMGRWSPCVGTLSLGSKKLKKLQRIFATSKFHHINQRGLAFDFCNIAPTF